jgi:KipI family sensor histidine kinase inhibitor
MDEAAARRSGSAAIPPPPAVASRPRIEPLGDAAVLITLGHAVNPALAERSQALAAALEAARADVPALGRAVPAHASVLLPFDPLALELDEVEAIANRAWDDSAVARATTDRDADDAGDGDAAAIEIPVRYGGGNGPDLESVAAVVGLSPSAVVELHAGGSYRVLFLGFAPGFGYLGGLDPRLATARRATPRERVPAGSVGIAGGQTAVYPLAMPGGWQLIGRTDAVLFDPRRDPPALFRPGATVRFVAVREP